MKITFHGAAQTVTGSQHLIEVNGRHLLLDCGLYQGTRSEAFERNRTLPFDPAQIDVMVLSPRPHRPFRQHPRPGQSRLQGRHRVHPRHRGPVRDMLLDSAHIQEKDVEFVNKKRARKGEPPFQPLYVRPMPWLPELVRAIGYHRSVQVLPGVHVTFLDAGHMLGSAIVVLDIEDRDAGRDVRLVFSGDLGRTGIPIIRDPETVDHADVLILESTYGDRLHEPYASCEKSGSKRSSTKPAGRGGHHPVLCRRAHAAVGLLAAPAERRRRHSATADLRRQPAGRQRDRRCSGCIPKPTTTKSASSCGDKVATIRSASDLSYTRSIEESKELNFLREPFIISASGMAETGRILHHLRNRIEDPRNHDPDRRLAGRNTLGRRIETGDAGEQSSARNTRSGRTSKS